MTNIISIIIPVRNEEDYIHDCISSVINFDYPKKHLEVIFVDGNSEDRTVDIIKEYQKNHPYIKILYNNKKIVPISMNLGIKESKGNYICRLDAHAKYPSNYISDLLGWSLKLNADNVGVVCDTSIKTNTYVAKSIKFVMSDKFGVGNSLFRTGIKEVKEVDTVPFGFYKREVFERNGLYNEKLIRVQDLEFNKRLKKNGGSIYLVPNLKCTYYPRENLKDFFKNRFMTGKWVILAPFYTNELKSISLRHLIPSFFCLFLLLSLVISFFSNFGLYVFLFIIGSYIIILFLRAILLTKKALLSIRILFAYLILHLSYGLGSFSAIKNIVFNKDKD